MIGIEIIDRNNLYIDAIVLLMNVNKQMSSKSIIDYLRKLMVNVNKIKINVGKNLTISKVEKNMSFIKELCYFFYSLETNNIQCVELTNTPRTFKTIFMLFKPLLTKNALQIISIKNEDPSNSHELSCNL